MQERVDLLQSEKASVETQLRIAQELTQDLEPKLRLSEEQAKAQQEEGCKENVNLQEQLAQTTTRLQEQVVQMTAAHSQANQLETKVKSLEDELGLSTIKNQELQAMSESDQVQHTKEAESVEEVVAYFHLPASTANEMLAAPVRVQGGAGTKSILEEAAASFQLPAANADDVLAAPVQVGAGTEFIPEDAAASFKLPASTADEVPVVPVLAGASTNVSAEALAGTEFIHGEPEPAVLGPIQQLPSLTVNEFILLSQSSPDPEQHPDPDLTNFASAASSRPKHQRRSHKRKAGRDSSCSNNVASIASSHSHGRL
jgi:23S rRNA maturation mini-RNase III